jgi:hypothetical protein
MLHIQSELKSGKTIPEVCDPLGIKYTIKDGKAIFTYDQIESPKTHPVVRECRGLVLYTNNFDVAAFPFERFFNYGESGADVFPGDLSRCLVLPKLDGSMCNLWWDRKTDEWHVSTRSMLYAEGSVNNLTDKTFADLFREAFSKTRLKDPTNLFISTLSEAAITTFTFELTSPLNRIVTPYKELNITLLTTRRNDEDLSENSLEKTRRWAEQIGCDVLKPVPITDWQELLKMQGLAATDEGFVVVRESKQGSHKRVKVKNPAYLAISRLVSSISERAFMELIQQNGQDEYLVYYPEHREYVDKLLRGLSKMQSIIKNDWLELYNIEDRKTFALEAQKRMFPSILFSMRDKRITNLSIDLLLLRTDNLLDMVRRVY